MDSIANAANWTQSRQSRQSQGLSGRRHRKCASNAWESARHHYFDPIGESIAKCSIVNGSSANGTAVCKANGTQLRQAPKSRMGKCREWDSIATIAGTVCKVSLANARVMRGIVCKASLLVRCGINRKCESNAWDCLLLSLQGGGRHYFEAWREAINREWDCKANGLNPKCRKWDSIATIAETVCMASITNARIMRGTICKASLLWSLMPGTVIRECESHNDISGSARLNVCVVLAFCKGIKVLRLCFITQKY